MAMIQAKMQGIHRVCRHYSLKIHVLTNIYRLNISVSIVKKHTEDTLYLFGNLEHFVQMLH